MIVNLQPTTIAFMLHLTCSIGLITSQTLVASTEQQHLCDFEGCSRTFSYLSRLIRHECIHTNKRVYKCTYEDCGKAFVEKSALNRHKLTHTGERPYKCTYENCGKAFSRTDQLTKHTHIHTGVKPFKCTYEGCGATFNQSGHLRRHKLMHIRKDADVQSRQLFELFGNEPIGDALAQFDPTTVFSGEANR